MPPPLFPKSFFFSKSPSSNTKFQERTKKTQPNMILQFPILFLLSFSNFLYFSASQSIYGALKSHGLPMGLLPKGIKDYQLDAMGNFTVFLDRECNAKFENELHYDRNVSGRLLYGQIANLTGVSAQDLFLWFPVKGIRVDVPSSGLIYFDVGVVFKQFSVSLFETPRDCLAVEPPEAAASKSQYGKLRYRRDSGDFGRAIL